jgi:Uma2 family endonuclease
MIRSTLPPTTTALMLDVSDTTLHISAEQFDRLCLKNPDLRLELTKYGELIVMPPAFGDTGKQNLDLGGQVWYWNRQTNLGEAFDSSTGYDFTALDGGKLSPDVSWIEKSKLEGVNLKKFISVVPDLVIELRSTSDNLKPLQAKMIEYQRLGVKMGLLIDPQNRQVEIYRSGRELEILASPPAIDCSEVMPEFRLDLARIWQD